MRIGIICAEPHEAVPFLPMFDKPIITEKAMLKFYQGQIGSSEAIVMCSGICKVNAAVATQILIDTYKCHIIINSGTAGGIDESLKVFDTVVSTEVAYHDVSEDILTDSHPCMDSVFFKADSRLLESAKEVSVNSQPPRRIFFGRMVTGEQFIQDSEREEIKKNFTPLSVDMETAAVAHVCYVNKIPFIAVRTITDTANHDGKGNFRHNCETASRLSADFVKMMLLSPL